MASNQQSSLEDYYFKQKKKPPHYLKSNSVVKAVNLSKPEALSDVGVVVSESTKHVQLLRVFDLDYSFGPSVGENNYYNTHSASTPYTH